jgi:hypothetical protein
LPKVTFLGVIQDVFHGFRTLGYFPIDCEELIQMFSWLQCSDLIKEGVGVDLAETALTSFERKDS